MSPQLIKLPSTEHENIEKQHWQCASSVLSTYDFKSFNSHNNPMTWVLFLLPTFIHEDTEAQRLNNLPQVTQQQMRTLRQWVSLGFPRRTVWICSKHNLEGASSRLLQYSKLLKEKLNLNLLLYSFPKILTSNLSQILGSQPNSMATLPSNLVHRTRA